MYIHPREMWFNRLSWILNSSYFCHSFCVKSYLCKFQSNLPNLREIALQSYLATFSNKRGRLKFTSNHFPQPHDSYQSFIMLENYQILRQMTTKDLCFGHLLAFSPTTSFYFFFTYWYIQALQKVTWNQRPRPLGTC